MDANAIRAVLTAVKPHILAWDWERIGDERRQELLEEISEVAIKTIAETIIDQAADAVTCCPCCADDVRSLLERYR